MPARGVGVHVYPRLVAGAFCGRKDCTGESYGCGNSHRQGYLAVPPGVEKMTNEEVRMTKQ